MKKVNVLLTFSIGIFLAATTNVKANGFSDGLEQVSERAMLNSIEYIEEHEEIELDFDTYFYLPFNFNAYEGMELDINTIEYIEIEEEDL